MYECNLIALLAELFGGMAFGGNTHIMDIVSENIYQRSPVFIGSKGMAEIFRS